MFNVLLKKTRKRKNFSQTDMVELLCTHPNFEKLDKGTYSRWENGRTTPSTQRQIQVMLINSSLKDALLLAKTVAKTKPATSLEERLFNKRFSNSGYSNLGGEISEFHYEINNAITCKARTTIQNTNPKIKKLFEQLWGNLIYNDLNNLINPQSSNYLLLEHYNSEGILLSHHMIYLTTIHELNNLTTTKKSIEHDSLRYDNVVFSPCTYSSSITTFCVNILETVSFCLKSNFNPEFVYIKTSRTAFKEYLESLGGTVITLGCESTTGLKHFNKTYQWVGIIAPFSNIVLQTPTYEAIYNSLGRKIEITYLKE
ncbi:helix-turn-helix domain-containing protein [Vibrio hyugaensis]|uniref:helix-turn-helix domain-containing protein n=1 Tax=Vibrio hyugaensis TaxID=1534743 RepID=UPI0005EEA31E|nr:helix-turn-helix transcriptional regulator [Vibrio hyugaensis]